MTRIPSVDVARGLVMMLMALDHVRVYSGVAAGGPDPAVFLTRWVTHFCAPTFFFLAGVSARLSMRRRGRGGVARLLVVRGVWLVLLELTYLRVAWGFDLAFDSYLSAGVIWSLGWCMVGLAALVFLPPAITLAGALVMIAGHDAVGAAWVTSSPWVEEYPWWACIGYTGGLVRMADGPVLIVLYSLVPWLGVMAAGFAAGAVFSWDAARRNRLWVRVGLGCVALFVLLRASGWYGDPRPWDSFGDEWPPWVAFLNTSKYPASLCYLLMTLGPLLLALPVLDRLRGFWREVPEVFGRMPMFFYLLHIPLCHGLPVLLALWRSPGAIAWLCTDQPFPLEDPPEGYTYGLPLLYGMWLLVLVIGYQACRRYARARPRLPSLLRSLL